MPSPDSRFLIPDSFLRRLRDAERLTILTGAGVSAASGVPTFRGAAGLWRQFRPEELATADAFRRDPALVWDWYAWRQQTIAGCEPNAAHLVIAQLSQRDGCRVLTQNVDDLHVRAGTRQLIRLHGSIWKLKCWNGCGQAPWGDRGPVVASSTGHAADGPADHSLRLRNDAHGLPRRVRNHAEDTLPRDRNAALPACPGCGGLARPAVVWFGESLDPDDISAALAACDCDLFLTVGTSALVYPAAGFAHEASRHGAFTAEINLDATPATSTVDLSIRGAAEVILPALIAPRSSC